MIIRNAVAIFAITCSLSISNSAQSAGWTEEEWGAARRLCTKEFMEEVPRLRQVCALIKFAQHDCPYQKEEKDGRFIWRLTRPESVQMGWANADDWTPKLPVFTENKAYTIARNHMRKLVRPDLPDDQL